MPPSSKSTSFSRRNRAPDLHLVLREAEALILKEQYPEAQQLLQETLMYHGRAYELHVMLGETHRLMGSLAAAVLAYETALVQGGPVSLWISLAYLYGELELLASSIRAFRKLIRHDLTSPFHDQHPQVILEGLEKELKHFAQLLHLPLHKVEKGLREMEQGICTLSTENYRASMAHSRKAAQILKTFPPPYNNLSMAQFYHGNHEQAIHTAQKVLRMSPVDVHAQINLMRFLKWTGASEKAQSLWLNLREQAAGENIPKLIEGAAIMEDDHTMHTLLQEIIQQTGLTPSFNQQTQLFWGIAQANLGHVKEAVQSLRQFAEKPSRGRDIYQALRAGRHSLGFTDRFAYVHSLEMIPREALIQATKTRLGEADDREFKKQMQRLAMRYPQVVLMGEKMIWEENQVSLGIELLEYTGTEEAGKVLHKYALSSFGEDDHRFKALFALQRMGLLDPNESVNFWLDGKQEPTQLSMFEVTEEKEVLYEDRIYTLLEQSLAESHRNQDEKSEKTLLHILQLNPNVKEAYNNLAKLYLKQGKRVQAETALQQALEVDPTYPFSLLNLATMMLNDERIEEARTLVLRLAHVKRMHPQEAAFMGYVQARLALEDENVEAAEEALKMSLSINPDLEIAQNLLEAVQKQQSWEQSWRQMRVAQNKRNQKLRAKNRLKTRRESALFDILGLYSKEILTGIGRIVIAHGGWSSLKKAELQELLVRSLLDEDNLARLYTNLNPQVQEALNFVVAADGLVAWDIFVDNFDDDLQDSPYWNYHTPDSLMGTLRATGLLYDIWFDEQNALVIPDELLIHVRNMLAAQANRA